MAVADRGSRSPEARAAHLPLVNRSAQLPASMSVRVGLCASDASGLPHPDTGEPELR